MTKKYSVCCVSCQRELTDCWWLCPKCGGSLEIKYFQTSQKPQFPLATKPINSFGEGSTPLIQLKNMSQQLGADIWAKCEYQNPTCSFKDRGSLIEILKAVELGKKGVVCASTGNMAASLSAYAARAGLKCKVVVPEQTPPSKLQQAIRCGAQIVAIAGTYDNCVSVAQAISQTENYFLCGDYVLRREGQKTVGWELAANNFDSFIVPVGNGTVGVAIAQGLSEAFPSNITRFVGVQAQGANPIQLAWASKKEIVPQSNTTTIASACNVGSPLDGNLTLSWIQKSNGQLISVSDAEILAAQALLAEKEGIYVESAAAATLAGLIKLKDSINNQKIVLILTGSGLKERAT